MAEGSSIVVVTSVVISSLVVEARCQCANVYCQLISRAWNLTPSNGLIVCCHFAGVRVKVEVKSGVGGLLWSSSGWSCYSDSSQMLWEICRLMPLHESGYKLDFLACSRNTQTSKILAHGTCAVWTKKLFANGRFDQTLQTPKHSCCEKNIACLRCLMPDDAVRKQQHDAQIIFYDSLMMMTMRRMKNLEVIIVDWKRLFHGGSLKLCRARCRWQQVLRVPHILKMKYFW